MNHLAVFGDPFDLPARAAARWGRVRTTVFVQRSRLHRCTGLDAADAVVALPDDAGTDEWTHHVRAVHALHPITHAAALVDHLAVPAAHALAGLGVPFHDPAVLGRVCDKALMRAALHRAGVHPVPHRPVPTAADLTGALAHVGLPCVVKPTSATGSLGVTVVRSAPEAAAAHALAASAGGEVLVESYLAGPQYSVEAFSQNHRHEVLAVTRKYSCPRTAVEIAHVLPAPLDAAAARAVAGCAVAVLDTLGIAFGPSHTEVVLTAAGPAPLETHARVGGDDIWLMVHAATGVDLDEVQAEQVLGGDAMAAVHAVLRGPGTVRPAQAVWFGTAARADDFAGLTVPGPVAADPHVTVEALVGPGGQVRPLRSSADRVFKVRAVGGTPAQALERARLAARAVARASGLDTGLTRCENLC